MAMDTALERVRAGGGRLTKARRDLLHDLHEAPVRVTAEELVARHPDIDQATVYRSLSHFEEVGVVEHVHLGHGPALSLIHISEPTRLRLKSRMPSSA